MKKYIKQTEPFIVPTDDDKYIEEYFGNASLHYDGCGFYKIEVPPRWKEPHQTPEFDEIVLVNKGKIEITIDKERVVLNTKESILLKKNNRIRFRNPFDDPCEFFSICLPPFSLKTVHRE